MMSRQLTFILYFAAIFLQAGAYGLTFMLPRLFANFGASEKAVGSMLFITAMSTVVTVYYSGHLSDLFGRLRTLGLACFAIAAALFLYGVVSTVGPSLILASALLGFGWGLTYALGPIVLTRLVNPEERVSAFALLSVFVMAGFGLSPVLAAFLETIGYAVAGAFFITSGLCVISAILFGVLNAPVKAHAINPGPEASSRITLTSMREVLGSRALVPVIMVCLGASVWQTALPDHRAPAIPDVRQCDPVPVQRG